jgi:hypothetical protein
MPQIYWSSSTSGWLPEFLSIPFLNSSSLSFAFESSGCTTTAGISGFHSLPSDHPILDLC